MVPSLWQHCLSCRLYYLNVKQDILFLPQSSIQKMDFTAVLTTKTYSLCIDTPPRSKAAFRPNQTIQLNGVSAFRLWWWGLRGMPEREKKTQRPCGEKLKQNKLLEWRHPPWRSTETLIAITQFSRVAFKVTWWGRACLCQNHVSGGMSRLSQTLKGNRVISHYVDSNCLCLGLKVSLGSPACVCLSVNNTSNTLIGDLSCGATISPNSQMYNECGTTFAVQLHAPKRKLHELTCSTTIALPTFPFFR